MITNEELIEIAKEARKFACVPILDFKVGAALLDAEGNVFQGCNIQDPSGIGITNICAERCAVIKAISSGSDNYVKIAIVGGEQELEKCMPCGACLQFLHSFAPDIKIVLEDNGEIEEYILNALLPYAFDERF